MRKSPIFREANVTWLENGSHKEIRTNNPTDEVAKIAARLNGEIPELQVIRPSLEDIYLEMIGEAK